MLPGLVNTHHHLYQTLTSAVPAAQNAVLFDWLKTLYPIWAQMDPDAVYTSTLVGCAELLLSGCTTASDHLYIFPNGARLDDEIRAAQEIGIRSAIGASPMQLLVQFLAEAVVLALVGSLAGVFLGWLSSSLVAQAMNWSGGLSVLTIVGAASFGTSVGVAFGYLPARRAAQLEPIEALRHE